MRVSKQTAILLKEAGYDVPCNLVPNSCMVDDSGNILYLPTLHEAADWERSNGVHVWVSVSHSWTHWQYRISIQWETHEIRSEYIYNTHEAAYEAGIVHGLKYLP